MTGPVYARSLSLSLLLSHFLSLCLFATAANYDQYDTRRNKVYKHCEKRNKKNNKKIKEKNGEKKKKSCCYGCSSKIDNADWAVAAAAAAVAAAAATMTSNKGWGWAVAWWWHYREPLRWVSLRCLGRDPTVAEWLSGPTHSRTLSAIKSTVIDNWLHRCCSSISPGQLSRKLW